MPSSHSLLGYFFVAISYCTFVAQPLHAQSREEATVTQSIEVFKAIDKLAIQGIPRELLRDAHAIAIIPNVIKGSLVIGMRRGHGVLMVRDEQSRWGAPIFVTLTGGNIGWQVGVQSTDVILVFKSRRSIDGIFNGKFTWVSTLRQRPAPLDVKPRQARTVNFKQKSILILVVAAYLLVFRLTAQRFK